MNYQKAILVGNVTKDANRQVVAFVKLGEVTANYVAKGSQALVEGRIQLSEKGQLSIIADKVQFGTRLKAVEKAK
jgi:single-stranded DNA-binding protein